MNINYISFTSQDCVDYFDARLVFLSLVFHEKKAWRFNYLIKPRNCAVLCYTAAPVKFAALVLTAVCEGDRLEKLHLTLARRALPTKQTYKCLKLHSRNIERTKRFLVSLFVSWLSVTFEETITTDFNNFCRRNCPRAAIQKRVSSEHCQHYNYK
jgi:hypothetical protein